MGVLKRLARKQMTWWAILFLPIFLHALIPVGYMPMVGRGHAVELVICDGDGPLLIAVPMTMDMPAGMAMHDDSASSGPTHQHSDHHERGSCAYGSAPALGALPSLAIFASVLVQISREAPLATAQVAYVEVSPRAQAPRGPPA